MSERGTTGKTDMIFDLLHEACSSKYCQPTPTRQTHKKHTTKCLWLPSTQTNCTHKFCLINFWRNLEGGSIGHVALFLI